MSKAMLAKKILSKIEEENKPVLKIDGLGKEKIKEAEV